MSLLSFRRVFIAITVLLFLGIGVAGFVKRDKTVTVTVAAKPQVIIEQQQPVVREGKEIDRVRRFFSKGMDKLPIVETITYSSRVPWLKGRPAWIADYASHYQTSRHFIARSLNGKADYITQNITPGNKFNVLRDDKQIQFYLLVNLSDCTMDFYYLDLDANERVFLKTYLVGVGRLDPASPSGSLTPTGKYMLGSKIAVYKPGIEHFFQNRKTQMIEVFGTRWIPFEEEVENCTDSAKGYGIHGLPCKYDIEKNLLIEEEKGVNGYNSDGCLRLKMCDMEEIFAIVVTKPTMVEIVKSKQDVTLPMLKENCLEDGK